MSGRYNIVKEFIVKPVTKTIKNIVKGGKQKTTGTEAVKNVPISPNLKKFQEQKEEVIQTTDKYTKDLTQEGKTNVRKYVAPALSKISKLTQRLPVKKAKGGRIGYKKEHLIRLLENQN